MAKKVIVFDLDGTLVVSKTNITASMGKLILALFDKFDVAIISGGAFEQFKTQVIDQLAATPTQLVKLHILPTCGTKYYTFDIASNDWKLQYDIALSEEQRKRAAVVLEEGAKKLGIWENNTFGDIIEDRGSQVTFSGLGQKAPANLKYDWDPKSEKKQNLRDYAAKILPDLEVRVGGSTSVDVTLKGVDKAFGMRKLMEQMDITMDQILFIGDRLQPGGNDYPVKEMGIDFIEVADPDEAERVITGLLGADKLD